jgi:hypothetical protein
MVKIINQWRHQAIMTYTAVYIDGDQIMVIRVGDQEGYLRWMAIIAKIKDEAARITAECPDPEQQTAANIMYSFGHYFITYLIMIILQDSKKRKNNVHAYNRTK